MGPLPLPFTDATPYSLPRPPLQANVPERGAAAGPYASTASTARLLWAEGGVGALYSGVVPRGVRLTGAVFLLSTVRERVLGLLGASSD